ncbi:mandelate racemase/muconate lactonizing enzyme family protein [Halobacteriales archaeon Cl-PHB]
MGRDYRGLRDPNAEYTNRDLSSAAMGLGAARAPGPRDLAITDLQTTMVDGNFPWTLVRVYTDAGVVGTGEAYWGAGVPELVDRITPFLVGENPLDLDRLYEHMVQKMSGEGSLAGVTVTAISGIELALVDLAGKVHDAPAYQLLGGKYRDSVRMYCDCHAGDEASPRANADEAARVVDELGYDALKFDLDVPTPGDWEPDRANRHLRQPAIDHKATIVETVTERVPAEVEVAFDCHWTYSRGSAERLAMAVDPFDVWWLEDPVPPENHDVQREVSRNTTTPTAAGENVYRKHGVRRLLEEQAVDILTPDLPKVGGMLETRKIADLADLYYTPLALHNVGSPVATMASAQVGAAIPNVLAVEFHSYELDWWGDLVEETVIEDGRIEIPESPGLGLTLDLDAVGEHMVDGETLFDPA